MLGIALHHGASQEHLHEYDYASLDRVMPELGYVPGPELGYVPGNVRVISFRANTIKNNASMREIEQLLEWLRRVTPLSDEKPNNIEELVAFAERYKAAFGCESMA